MTERQHFVDGFANGAISLVARLMTQLFASTVRHP
jgi:hypothetical protein